MNYVVIVLKLAATTGLLWFVFSKIELEHLAATISGRQIAAALAAGVLVLSVHAFAKAVRLRLCCRFIGHDITLAGAWVACQFGGFFSHTPASFLGGDAMRIWQMSREGMPVGDAAKAVLLDRALGFIGLMVLVLASAPAIYQAVPSAQMWAGFVLLVALGMAMLVVFLLLGRLRPWTARSRVLHWAGQFATLARYLAVKPQKTVQAIALAVFIAALNVAGFWAVGTGYPEGPALGTTFAAGPVVQLIAMIPISVAGWGLREGAFLMAFGLFGLPAEAALTVSMSFGIAFLLTYLPAPVLWFFGRRSAALRAAR